MEGSIDFYVMESPTREVEIGEPGSEIIAEGKSFTSKIERAPEHKRKLRLLTEMGFHFSQ